MSGNLVLWSLMAHVFVCSADHPTIRIHNWGIILGIINFTAVLQFALVNSNFLYHNELFLNKNVNDSIYYDAHFVTNNSTFFSKRGYSPSSTRVGRISTKNTTSVIKQLFVWYRTWYHVLFNGLVVINYEYGKVEICWWYQ